ncbi:unnamed protein product [Ectocarpus fasciculatus]
MSPVLNLTLSFVPASIGPCRYSLNPLPSFNRPYKPRPGLTLISSARFCFSLRAKATDISSLNPSRPSISNVLLSSMSNPFQTPSTTLTHSVGCLPLFSIAHFAFQAVLGNLSSPIPHMRSCHVSFLSCLPDFRGRIPSSAVTAALLVRLTRGVDEKPLLTAKGGTKNETHHHPLATFVDLLSSTFRKNVAHGWTAHTLHVFRGRGNTNT